jgi:hypothetical protein
MTHVRVVLSLRRGYEKAFWGSRNILIGVEFHGCVYQDERHNF